MSAGQPFLSFKLSTFIEAPMVVLELKDSPLKVKLGYEEIKETKLNKPEQGFFKKISVKPLRYIQEFRSTDNKEYKVGQEIKADLFKPGDFVTVTGTSIGKGFQAIVPSPAPQKTLLFQLLQTSQEAVS